MKGCSFQRVHTYTTCTIHDHRLVDDTPPSRVIFFFPSLSLCERNLTAHLPTTQNCCHVRLRVTPNDTRKSVITSHVIILSHRCRHLSPSRRRELRRGGGGGGIVICRWEPDKCRYCWCDQRRSCSTRAIMPFISTKPDKNAPSSCSTSNEQPP